MSGMTIPTEQNNMDRNIYMTRVRDAITKQNMMQSGEPGNVIQSFGALYGMREIMNDDRHFFSAGYKPYDRSGGQREIHSFNLNSHKNEDTKEGGFIFSPLSLFGQLSKVIGGEMPVSDTDDENDEFDRKVGGFLPLVYAPLYYGIKKLFGGKKADEYKQLSGGLGLLDFAMPVYGVFKRIFGGNIKKLDKFKKHYDKYNKSGGMVLSKEAQEFHKKRKGGRAPTGADFSGADIVNSEPLKNSGPDVGSKASLGDLVPNNNAGAGVQSWTEYPNKNLSNEDIKEATATTRDIQNDFPVANKPSIDAVFNSIMKLARGKRNYTEKSIGGAINKKMYKHLSGIPTNKLHEYIQAGKKCGGNVNSTCGGALKKKIDEELKQGGFFGPLNTIMKLGDAIDTVGKIPFVDKAVRGIGSLFGLGKDSSTGGAAVASPNIPKGDRSAIIPGINTATQIDGFQDPRTIGLASQAGVGAPLGGKKRRNRKPMTPEQKREFSLRMAEAKLKKRKQK